MGTTRKILTFPLLILVSILEKITRPVWDFMGTCFFFWICFTAANSGIEPGNISNALRAVFWDAVLALTAFQTLPQLFFKMFDCDN